MNSSKASNEDKTQVADRPRVLFIVGTMSLGGAENLVFEWCRALYNEKVSCAIVCLIRREGHYLSLVEEMGIPVFEISQAKSSKISFTWKLGALIASYGASIVHSQCSWSLTQQALASKLGRAKAFLLTMHSAFAPGSRTVRLKRKIANLIAAPFINKIIGVSDNVSIHAAEWTGKDSRNIVTIRNGIDLTAFDTCRSQRHSMRAEFGVADDVPLLINVANLTAHKDHATLFTAFKILLQRWPLAHLLIVGDGQLRETLAQLALDLRISKSLTFVGRRTDVPAILGAGDVFVLSSIREGFGLALVEAGAASIPVVATRVGGIPEVVRHGETGLLVPPGDPPKLAESIEIILSKEDFGREMGSAGRRFVTDRFGIDRCFSEYLDLYKGVLGAEWEA